VNLPPLQKRVFAPTLIAKRTTTAFFCRQNEINLLAPCTLGKSGSFLFVLLLALVPQSKGLQQQQQNRILKQQQRQQCILRQMYRTKENLKKSPCEH